MDMLEQIQLLDNEIKKACDRLANEIKFNKDFVEMEVHSNAILNSTKALVDIYLFTDQYQLEDNDPRKHDLFKKRVVEINKSLKEAKDCVDRLDLVKYIEVVKKMVHNTSRLVQLTAKYIELGELPPEKDKEREMPKRHKIDEQFNEWKDWVKEYQVDLAYYEPLMPYVEDSERQTRLAQLVKKLKKLNKENKNG
jgi:hypothetical protein